MKKPNYKQQLELSEARYKTLSEDVKTYVSAMSAVKARSAFFYKGTEQAAGAHNSLEGPKQFNVVQVKELIASVLTATQLNFDTVLTATDNQLTVNYVEKRPRIPISMQVL